MMNESKSELRTSMPARIRAYYYSFYDDAYFNVLSPFIACEVDIFLHDDNPCVKETMRIAIIYRFLSFSDWIIGDDRDIFLSEGAT